MNQSDYVVLGAMAVSLLSALYSRWSANEAKRANQISLRFDKIEIYEEVLSFSDYFRGVFNIPTAERLERFRKQAVQRAEIHLSSDVYLQLQKTYKHCSENEIWLSIAEGGDAVNSGVPSVLEIRSEYTSVLELFYPVIEKIRNVVKLAV